MRMFKGNWHEGRAWRDATFLPALILGNLVRPGANRPGSGT
jgi:hypothetical protein